MVPLYQVQRHVAQNRKIIGAIAVAVSRLVLVHHDVENPVEPVLNAPVQADNLAEALGRQRRARQAVSGLRHHAGQCIASAGHLSYGS